MLLLVSITTFAGQNFGAGKYDRIRKSVRICMGMAAFTSVLLSVIVLAGGRGKTDFTDKKPIGIVGSY